MIEVYTAKTPNGIKIPIALEEMGEPYKLVRVRLSEGEQKTPDFLKISPNGRIPAIVDPDGPNGPLSVFESGAILVYLAEKFGKLIPSDIEGRVRALEWTFFQVAGIGPMFGQVGYFRRSDPPVETAVDRFQKESQRLVDVMETRLSQVPYLAGPELSIADIANFGWLDHAERYAGVAVPPAVAKWREGLRNRRAFQKGIVALDLA